MTSTEHLTRLASLHQGDLAKRLATAVDQSIKSGVMIAFRVREGCSRSHVCQALRRLGLVCKAYPGNVIRGRFYEERWSIQLVRGKVGHA